MILSLSVSLPELTPELLLVEAKARAALVAAFRAAIGSTDVDVDPLINCIEIVSPGFKCLAYFANSVSIPDGKFTLLMLEFVVGVGAGRLRDVFAILLIEYFW